MKIYFSCSLTGGRDYEETYGFIVDRLFSLGHVVLTAHLARPEVMEDEKVVDANEVFHRDIDWIHECDTLIAEVSTPSHGVGYEIAYALALGKPVLCVYNEGVKVSKMIIGNDSPRFYLESYEERPQIVEGLNCFLNKTG